MLIDPVRGWRFALLAVIYAGFLLVVGELGVPLIWWAIAVVGLLGAATGIWVYRREHWNFRARGSSLYWGGILIYTALVFYTRTLGGIAGLVPAIAVVCGGFVWLYLAKVCVSDDELVDSLI
ncbi:hypothetical protein GCM10027417_30050 [Glutamicibacter endophyticus]